MGREDKQVKQHYYVTSSQKLSHTSCVLEKVEHCGGEPEQVDTGYHVTNG